MAVVGIEEFLVLYDDFKVLEPTKVQATLDYAERSYCPASSWGKKQRDGIMLLTAHFLTMNWLQKAEIVGATSAIAQGQGGRSPTSSDNDFQLTSYGRQYLQLRHNLAITGLAF